MGTSMIDGKDIVAMELRRAAEVPVEQDGDGLPGRDERAQSGLHRRRADHRGPGTASGRDSPERRCASGSPGSSSWWGWTRC